MATRHKDFGDTGVYRAENLEPLTFSLLGNTFSCHPMLPGYQFMSLVARVGSEGAGSVTVAAMLEFLENALLDEDWARLETVLNDPNIVVSTETIGAIVEFLVESYSERPTERPSTSVDGLQPTGPALQDAGSSSEASTPAVSTV